ncbi:putative pyruvyl transferase EpsO [Shewanella sp. P1-14-1]|uniref:polysaccharide pyruvyl transferase family protein n=1 Tax=Shewanella sp. P1-14-1 TaxID=1723761 RepID=UPI0006D68E34|nr:polysaccharide pyruvyl transferase family protein [Shewanella sp. P1-14-1]KPZ72585.1 putative pyruvyl transferase EpsO [Shewanella sp. P1-14-1]
MIEVSCSVSKLLEQKEELLKVFKPLLENKKVLFLDVPVNLNVGDSLLYLGTLELFKLLNVTIIDSISAYEPARLDKLQIEEDVVCVLQGGGNFGDIYSLHQNFRHLALSKFPNNQFVLMPQSIHYSNLNTFKDDCDFYRTCRNFSIFVRDEHSFEQFVSENVSQVTLCPDIATVLFGTFNPSEAAIDSKLYFLRKDVEAAPNTETAISVDWIDIIPKHLNRLFEISKFIIKKNNRLNIRGLTGFLVNNLHTKLVHKAYSYFIGFKTIKTDRLHGLILSQLLQMNCEALDNKYKKLERYIKRWYA